MYANAMILSGFWFNRSLPADSSLPLFLKLTGLIEHSSTHPLSVPSRLLGSRFGVFEGFASELIEVK